MSRYKNIVFDVGSVLVNWMRMNLYTTLFNGNKACLLYTSDAADD